MFNFLSNIIQETKNGKNKKCCDCEHYHCGWCYIDDDTVEPMICVNQREDIFPLDNILKTCGERGRWFKKK